MEYRANSTPPLFLALDLKMLDGGGGGGGGGGRLSPLVRNIGGYSPPRPHVPPALHRVYTLDCNIQKLNIMHSSIRWLLYGHIRLIKLRHSYIMKSRA